MVQTVTTGHPVAPGGEDRRAASDLTVRRLLRAAGCLWLCFVLSACAGSAPLDALWKDAADEPGDEPHSLRERVESLPSPHIPDELQTVGVVQQGGAAPVKPVSSYSVDIVTPVAALEAPLRAASLLVRLEDAPPEDELGLDMRLRRDEEEALKIMQSFGYYGGTVRTEKTTRDGRMVVRIVLDPGPQYRMGSVDIRYERPAPHWEDAPRSLADVGLKPGDDAVAPAVVAAVDAVRHRFLNNGFPFIRLVSERYIVDHAAHTLEADLVYDPGDYVTMGKVRARGTETVKSDYFEKMRTWKLGDPWNADTLARYQDFLASQGLFGSIAAAPAVEADGGERRDVMLDLTDAPQRTVSAGIRFDTDRGPGLQAAWEHRNIAGEGERFRAEAEYWKDLQTVRGTFRIPAFLRRDTDFVAEGWAKNEVTDSFDQTAAWAGAGFDRCFWKIWMASIRATVEGGTLSSNRNPRSEYMMVGLPVTVRRDSTNDLLNPTRGTRASLSFTPYMGEMNREFAATVTRAEGSAYCDVMDNERLVLAGRVAAGTLMKDGGAVPASILFYSGGGGSVRGYPYQSLGPLDEDNNALGGMSMVETNLEMRIKVTDTIGVVPFLDGGNVFDESWPELADMSMRWAAGIGLRYYTSIGPVRFDAAVPLNKRKDDAPWQVYISIGQSF